jgi:bis(5'-nucleosidyl)-tetraphosphatase
LYEKEKMSGELRQAAGMILVAKESIPKLLLLKHPTRWDFPKGHVDAGEQLIETAFRETWEETGIDRESIQLDDSFQVALEYTVGDPGQAGFRKRVTYFLGFLEGIVPIRLTEHKGHEWISLPVVHSIQNETIDPIIDRLQKHLRMEPGDR